MKKFFVVLLLIPCLTWGWDRVQCPQCVKDGTKSTVQVLGSRTTLMGISQWYDEDGNYHHYDPNYTTAEYRCSRGHDFTSKDLNPKLIPRDSILTIDHGLLWMRNGIDTLKGK